jgi:hypothetical protein
MALRRRNIFAPREGLIQSAVIDHWKLLGVPGSLVAAIPNAYAHGQPGLTCGLPDLLVISPFLGRRTGFIELKADDGTPSGPQLDIRALMEARDIPYAMTFGRDEPIDVLERWRAVRKIARDEVASGALAEEKARRATEMSAHMRAWWASMTPERREQISMKQKLAKMNRRAASSVALKQAMARWARAAE